MLAYRYLTGKDDENFCRRVTRELSRGWQLYGQPTLAFDSARGIMICGQVVVKEVEGADYSDELVLSDL